MSKRKRVGHKRKGGRKGGREKGREGGRKEGREEERQGEKKGICFPCLITRCKQFTISNKSLKYLGLHLTRCKNPYMCVYNIYVYMYVYI